MKWILSLLATFLFYHQVNASECKVQGQVVVASRGGTYYFHECHDSGLGLMPRRMQSSVIADFLSQNRNNPQVQTMLDTVVPGMKFEDVIKALNDGETLVTPNKSELDPVAALYNERTGINNDIENAAARRRENGKKTPRSFDDLAKIAEDNAGSLPYYKSRCQNQKNYDGGKGLRPLQVHFEGDETDTHLFTAFNRISDTEFQVKYVTKSSDKEQTRTIKKEGNKLIWIAPDGKKWPLKDNAFTEITDDAYAAGRNFGSSSSSSMSAPCYLARTLPAINHSGSDKATNGTATQN